MTVHLCRGNLNQGIKQPSVGGLSGSKQVHLAFPESTPNELNYLRTKSPFSREGKLS